MNILKGYMETFESSLNKIEFEQLNEAFKKANVKVFLATPKDIDALKDDIYAIKNESPVVEALVKLLGIPRDGTAYKIRTGYMAYDSKNDFLIFASNKYDLPAYLDKRPS